MEADALLPDETNVTVWEIPKLSELRVEVHRGNSIKVKVESGSCEVFGQELVPSKEYSYEPSTFLAFFSWNQCKLIVIGQLEFGYISSETSMIPCINLHEIFQTARDEANKKSLKGPRIIVCGPPDVGKSTFSKLMANYSVRSSSQLIYVDIDLGQGVIGIPGCIGAFMVDRPMPHDFDYHNANPLVYSVGHNSITNLTLTNHFISLLAKSVNEKLSKISKLASGGIIINSCGYIVGVGFDCLQHSIEQFDCDHIIVIDQERLHNQLSSHPNNSSRKVLYLPKLGGVTLRNQDQRRFAREKRIKSYFYGATFNLHPRIFDLSFDDVKIYQIGAPELPSSCLPIGMGGDNVSLKIICLPPNVNMVHHVCAVASADDENEILESPVLGFLVINSVNLRERKFTVLSPSPAPLPKLSLIISESMSFIHLIMQSPEC